MSLSKSNAATSRLATARARNAQQLQASSSADTSYTREYKRFKTWAREHGVIDHDDINISLAILTCTSASMQPPLIVQGRGTRQQYAWYSAKAAIIFRQEGDPGVQIPGRK
jgi:hypothetical protein